MATYSYSGIAFPPRKSARTGFFTIATDNELVKNSVYVILNTKKGSMPMIGDFGSSAQDMLFEPINELTQSLIADMLVTDIERWEPRVQVVSMKASSQENTRIFEIVLRIKATGELVPTTASFSV